MRKVSPQVNLVGQSRVGKSDTQRTATFPNKIREEEGFKNTV